MTTEPLQTIKVFYSYSHKDKGLKDKLDQHLQALKRSGKITTWSDHEIQPGREWEAEIFLQLNTADIILLLISPDFMASDYCYGVEMQQAYARHDVGETYIIPILLRPIFLESMPIQKLQMLPSGGKPVVEWSQRDKAFEDIARGIYRVVERLLARKRGNSPLSDSLEKEPVLQVQEEAIEHASLVKSESTSINTINPQKETSHHMHDQPPVSEQSAKTCPSCHAMNRTESRFCKQCGWPFRYSKK